MPLTPFQREVLHLLAAQRNPESYLAGGAALNREKDSPRYSEDLDLFHDVAESVGSSAEADAAVLASRGFTVTWVIHQPSFRRAKVTRGQDGLRLDWTYDSAFRFFPVQPDLEFGYCLHRADLATNKVLALAGRSEFRDFVDILNLHETYLSLGATCWAACGKDPGFTPWLILELSQRHVHFRPEDMAGVKLAQPLSLTDLKQKWLAAVDQAEALFGRLPTAEAGCLYLTQNGEPHTPDPARPDFATDIRHFGSVRGAWPTIAGT
jgi:hypothetical protein